MKKYKITRHPKNGRTAYCGTLTQRKLFGLQVKLQFMEVLSLNELEVSKKKKIERVAKIFLFIKEKLEELGYDIEEIRESTEARTLTDKRNINEVDRYINEKNKSR